ncbi:MAG: alpha/beta hydrolase [Pseudomonadota bacterium]
MRSKRHIVLVALWLSLFPALVAAGPEFEFADCPFEVPQETRDLKCGYLTVPENRAEPEVRTLRLAVAILESHSDSPKPDPLVFLDGGPGGATLQYVPARIDSPFWNRYREDRDLIFLDQRGIGYSDPAFCLELDVVLTTAGFQGLSPDEQRREELAAVRACRESMLEKGIDFAHYNSATSAQDLADLRIALEVDEWNLFGVSYGTRLALVALREAPKGIRSVIVDSVYPPNASETRLHENFDRSLRLVFDRCATDLSCAEAFPSLEADFYAMLVALEAEPVELSMTDTQRFPDGRIVIDGSLMAAGIFQGLYDGRFVELLPLLVREVSAGNEDVLRALADGLVGDPHDVRRGLYLAVQCFEATGRVKSAAIEADRAAYPALRMWNEGRDDLALCDAWHAARAGEEFARPVQSDVPVLLVTGDYDPITPPGDARLASETLPNGTLVIVPGAGHAASPSRDCTQNLVREFLDAPERPLDTSCTSTFQAPKFVTEVDVKPGISRLMTQVGGERLPTSILVVAMAVLLMASATVVWPCAWAWARIRGRAVAHPPGATRARWLAVLVGLLSLGYLGALASVVLGSLSDNPYILAFGVPAGSEWVFVIAWLVMAAALVSFACVAIAWRARWWSLNARIYYTLVAVAGIVFVAWLLFAGLF